MRIQVSMEVRAMLLLILMAFALFVFGENRETKGVDINQQPSSNMHRKQLSRPPPVSAWWVSKHTLDELFSSKRKVPNTSDPLHNR